MERKFVEIKENISGRMKEKVKRNKREKREDKLRNLGIGESKIEGKLK